MSAGQCQPDIVVVGSVNVDHLVRVTRHPHPGETLLGWSSELLPGGKGANQAVAAARLGGKVSLVGAVGEDADAELALSLLREAGVGLSTLRVLGPSTGRAYIAVADDGENTIIVAPGSNAALEPAHIRQAEGVIGPAAVLMLQGEVPGPVIEAAVGVARGRVVLNLAPVVALSEETLRAADPLVVNEHEAALALGKLGVASPHRTGGFEDSARSGCVPEEVLAQALLDAGIPSVVITRGARGAVCADDNSMVAVPAPVVEAVDTSGAGDAFTGALGFRLAQGDALADATRFAVRVGAYAVLSSGTQPSYPFADSRLPEVVPS